MQAEWWDITAKLAKLDAEQAHRQAEIVTVKELIKKIEGTLPISRQREADMEEARSFANSNSYGADRSTQRRHGRVSARLCKRRDDEGIW